MSFGIYELISTDQTTLYGHPVQFYNSPDGEIAAELIAQDGARYLAFADSIENAFESLLGLANKHGLLDGTLE